MPRRTALPVILAGLGLGLASAGCQPVEPVENGAGASMTQPGEPLARPGGHDRQIGSLVGEYRVAGIDGTEVGGGIGIALSVTDKLIWFEPRCAGFNWSYSYAGGVLATDRPQKPRAAGAPLVAGPMAATCRIAVHPEQQRLATALDAVTQVRRTPSNGIELTGGGHSVTLYSQ